VEGRKYPKKLVILRYCVAGEWHEEHAGRLIWDRNVTLSCNDSSEGVHSGIAEDTVLLRYDAESVGKRIPTFRHNVAQSS
jgi:hypothetical protein